MLMSDFPFSPNKETASVRKDGKRSLPAKQSPDFGPAGKVLPLTSFAENPPESNHLIIFFGIKITKRNF